MASPARGEDTRMQLWRHVPLSEWQGGFLLPADLTGDGQDMPVQVRWRADEDSLWAPVDRMVLDRRGEVVAQLGEWDERVVQDLRPGATKNRLAVQAIPVDLCGDAREELILYQPYQGRAVMIFTQPDSDGAAKPYVPQKNAYNRPAYF